MNDLTIYDTLAESWWRVGSPLHLLAQMNPARFAYFDPLVRHWAGLRVLDVGCGGGLAAACLVQRGAPRGGAGPVAGVTVRRRLPDPPAWLSCGGLYVWTG
jgi:2-polyprenyl-3-methyl-5-hydroxy-6-metoxy-1,4-benzoquinol methylase